MKRIMKIIVPSILMLSLIYLWREGKDILSGIYIIFPIMYIILGLICSDFKRELLISLILLSISFLIPINLLFKMGTCIDLIIFYNILSVVSYLIKKKLKGKKTQFKVEDYRIVRYKNRNKINQADNFKSYLLLLF